MNKLFNISSLAILTLSTGTALASEPLIPGIDLGIGITNVYQNTSQDSKDIPTNKNEYSGSLDIEIDLDLQDSLNISGGLFIHTESGWHPVDNTHEYSVRTMTGPNADFVGNRSFDIVELFYYNQLTESFTFNIGKMDMTGFFDTGSYANDETSQFLNGSLVNNSTIPFPDYGLGIVGSFQFTNTISLTAGVADAEAVCSETGFNSTFGGDDYFFYIAEAAYSPETELSSTYTLGLWYDPQPKSYSGSDLEFRDDTGLYFNYDQKLLNENDDDSQGLAMFFKYGYADKKKNDIHSYYSVGMQYQGLIDGRDDDVLGIGYANLGLTDLDGSDFHCHHEGIIETYYSLAICQQFTLSPDLQYIVNPDNGNLDNTLILGLRGQLNF